MKETNKQPSPLSLHNTQVTPRVILPKLSNANWCRVNYQNMLSVLGTNVAYNLTTISCVGRVKLCIWKVDPFSPKKNGVEVLVRSFAMIDFLSALDMLYDWVDEGKKGVYYDFTDTTPCGDEKELTLEVGVSVEGIPYITLYKSRSDSIVFPIVLADKIVSKSEHRKKHEKKYVLRWIRFTQDMLTNVSGIDTEVRHMKGV